MAIIKMIINNKCWQGCEARVTVVHCWWKCNLVHPLWKTVQTFLKKLKIELLYYPATPLLGVYNKTKQQNSNSKKYIHSSVHGSIIFNPQDMEAT